MGAARRLKAANSHFEKLLLNFLLLPSASASPPLPSPRLASSIPSTFVPSRGMLLFRPAGIRLKGARCDRERLWDSV